VLSSCESEDCLFIMNRRSWVLSSCESEERGCREGGGVYTTLIQFVYDESIKRELKTIPKYECRFDERLKTKAEESTRLVVSYKSRKRELHT
jgi:hypothetical protein